MKMFSILSRLTEKNFKNMKNLPISSAKRKSISNLWKICQSCPKNGEESQKYEKFANLILLNGEVFWNYEKYANLVLINGEEIINLEKIVNLVPLNGEEFREYQKFANLLLPINGKEFWNFCHSRPDKWRRNSKLW